MALFDHLDSLCHYHNSDEFSVELQGDNCSAVWAVGGTK